jgi:hypothetical protein
MSSARHVAADLPDDRWQRPPGTTDATVEALGRLSEALEYVHRVRGALYELHQLVGRADFLFEEAAELLRDAGHGQLADIVEGDVVGRNVLPGRWTFQVVEEFDDTYYLPVVGTEEHIRTELLRAPPSLRERAEGGTPDPGTGRARAPPAGARLMGRSRVRLPPPTRMKRAAGLRLTAV